MLRRKFVALVVPAFQLDLAPPASLPADGPAAARFFGASFHRVPSDMAALRECLRTQQCVRFYAHTSPETHATTPYASWADAASGAPPIAIRCFRSARYEPYVVLPNRPSTPVYSEAFTGYGKNKIELITHLRFAGFRFYAVPGAFIVHMPHVKSAQKLQWETGSHRARMDRLYRRVVAQLVARYKRPRTPSCHPGRLL